MEMNSLNLNALLSKKQNSSPHHSGNPTDRKKSTGIFSQRKQSMGDDVASAVDSINSENARAVNLKIARKQKNLLGQEHSQDYY